jgi:hypothetical protein
MSQNRKEQVHHLHGQPHSDAFDVPAEQLERVIARASVLQHAAGDSEQRRLSEEEVISIGREVGLSAEHVRRALAEYRADALVPPAPEEHPLLTRLLGPAYARARRVMRGDPQALHREFEQRLRSDERMRPVRLRGTESVWEPDSSWTSKLTRALDLEGRGYELAQLKSINIVTAPASPDESLVTLTADLSEERKEQLNGWSMALFFISLFVLVPFFFSKAWLWLLFAPALAGGIIVAGWIVHTSMNSKRRRAALLLEGLLDQLELRPTR